MGLEAAVLGMLALVQASVMWALKELYEIRHEVSGSHARINANIKDHERRITIMEAKWDNA